MFSSLTTTAVITLSFLSSLSPTPIGVNGHASYVYWFPYAGRNLAKKQADWSEDKDFLPIFHTDPAGGFQNLTLMAKTFREYKDGKTFDQELCEKKVMVVWSKELLSFGEIFGVKNCAVVMKTIRAKGEDIAIPDEIGDKPIIVTTTVDSIECDEQCKNSSSSPLETSTLSPDASGDSGKGTTGQPMVEEPQRYITGNTLDNGDEEADDNDDSDDNDDNDDNDKESHKDRNTSSAHQVATFSFTKNIMFLIILS